MPSALRRRAGRLSARYADRRARGESSVTPGTETGKGGGEGREGALKGGVGKGTKSRSRERGRSIRNSRLFRRTKHGIFTVRFLFFLEKPFCIRHAPVTTTSSHCYCNKKETILSHVQRCTTVFLNISDKRYLLLMFTFIVNSPFCFNNTVSTQCYVNASICNENGNPFSNNISWQLFYFKINPIIPPIIQINK